MPSTSFFKKIETKQKVETPGKDSGKVVRVTDDVVFEAVRRLVKAKEEIATLTAIKESLDDVVRDPILEEYSKLYTDGGVNPGTIHVEFHNSKKEKATVQFAPTDSYCLPDKAIRTQAFEKLVETFGKEILDNKEQITLDTVLFNKYESVIAKWLQSSKEISDEDKENLIKFDNKVCVKKGTNGMLHLFAKKAKMTVKDVIKAIGMTCQMRKTTIDVEMPVVTPSTKTIKSKLSTNV